MFKLINSKLIERMFKLINSKLIEKNDFFVTTF